MNIPSLKEFGSETGNDMSQQADDSKSAVNQIDPQARAALQKGIALHQAGQLQEALQWYQKVLKIEPGHGVALCNAGGIYQQGGQLDQAIVCFQKAVASQPGYFQGHMSLGNALSQKNNIPGALAAYRQALNLKPDHPAALKKLGIALRKESQPDQAAGMLQKALSIKPDDPGVLRHLGFVLMDLGLVNTKHEILCTWTFPKRSSKKSSPFSRVRGAMFH
ncbi:MAG: tetratricopeptide repeat protein [Magnetococcales bacterium]|nr:tetratricopeptide repeat protein [Magnetococcales bacterium]